MQLSSILSIVHKICVATSRGEERSHQRYLPHPSPSHCPQRKYPLVYAARPSFLSSESYYQGGDTTAGTLENAKRVEKFHERIDSRWFCRTRIRRKGIWGVQFNDAIVGGNIDDATTELVSKLSQSLEMLMFMSKCLGRGKNPGVKGSILNPSALQFSTIYRCHTSSRLCSATPSSACRSSRW